MVEWLEVLLWFFPLHLLYSMFVQETLLLIEDEPAIAKGLVYGLKGEGYAVLWAANGKQGLDEIKQKPPDLLILDIRLPDMNGFDICRNLRAEGHMFPILMLTARDEEADKVLGLELGADDYVVKPFSFRELVARVRALLRRVQLNAVSVQGQKETQDVRFGDVLVDFKRLKVFKAGNEVQLTNIEFRLLKTLVERPEIPFSRDELIEHIWGLEEHFGLERSIDVHMRHIREKIEDDPSQPVWFQTVRGIGYKFSNIKNS